MRGLLPGERKRDVAVGTEAQALYRACKRERGECIYGGCHARSVKGGMCREHYESEYERKLVAKVARMSSGDLLRTRERYRRSLRRVDEEIARRTGNA